MDTAALGHGDVIRGKRAHRGTVGLTPGNYSGMDALLRAHVRKIYILSQLVRNLGESVRGGKDRKTLPPEKGRTAPMYFEGLKLRGNICLTLAQPAELRGEGNSYHFYV